MLRMPRLLAALLLVALLPGARLGHGVVIRLESAHVPSATVNPTITGLGSLFQANHPTSMTNEPRELTLFASDMDGERKAEFFSFRKACSPDLFPEVHRTVGILPDVLPCEDGAPAPFQVRTGTAGAAHRS